MTKVLEIAPGYAEAEFIDEVQIDFHGTRIFFFARTRGDVVCIDLHPHRQMEVQRFNTLAAAIKSMFAEPPDDPAKTVRELFARDLSNKAVRLLLQRLNFEHGAELRVWQSSHEQG